MGKKAIFNDDFHIRHKEYARNKYRTNTHYQAEKKIKSKFIQALKRGSKKTSMNDLLGCTIVELKRHIEKQFLSEMTWDNHGVVWEIDHIEGLANFDSRVDSDLRRAWHFTNLRPLYRMDHRKLPKKRRQ